MRSTHRPPPLSAAPTSPPRSGGEQKVASNALNPALPRFAGEMSAQPTEGARVSPPAPRNLHRRLLAPQLQHPHIRIDHDLLRLKVRPDLDRARLIRLQRHRRA